MSQAAKLAIALAIAAAVAASAIVLPVGDYALGLVEYVRDAGAVGIVVFVAVYVVAAVAFLPGSVLTLAAGFVWGVWGGIAVVWPASMLGATAAFLTGRFVARDWVAGRVGKSQSLTAIDQAIGDESFTIIFLLRLSPLMPFSLLNYFLGITRARLRHYVLASGLGMIPAMFLYVYIGTLFTGAAQVASGTRPDAGFAGQALFIGGLIATATVTIYVSRLARKRLRNALRTDTEIDVVEVTGAG